MNVICGVAETVAKFVVGAGGVFGIVLSTVMFMTVSAREALPAPSVAMARTW